MIKTSSKQTGSAFLVIIITLTIAIIGTLGFVFWENYSNKQTTAPVKTTQTQKQQQPAITYKTYKDNTDGISFQYPSTWSLGQVVVSGIDRSVSVKNNSGDALTLESGIQGIGGTCGPTGLVTYSVIDAESTDFKATKPVTLSVTVKHNADGSFEAYYGLTDQYTVLGDSQTCTNTFYYLFDPGNTNYYLVAFGGVKHFATMSEVKNFISSDEYALIKKAILSLNY